MNKTKDMEQAEKEAGEEIDKQITELKKRKEEKR